MNQWTRTYDWFTSPDQTLRNWTFNNITAIYFMGDGSFLTGVASVNPVAWKLENETYNTTEDMIRAVNQTGLFYDIQIAWSNILDKFITAVDNIWIYMDGTTATFNETKLKEQIDNNITSANVSQNAYIDAKMNTIR